jgi:phosphatidylglycerol---prolipoprotein diacylglyceryl transferase
MYPILFSVGPVKIYSYGVMLAIAFLITLHLMSKRCAFFNTTKEQLNNLVIILLVSGIVGARILYVLLNLDFFLEQPLEVFMVNKGGLVFYGGLILSIPSCIIYAKKAKIKILDAADLISPYIALGHAIGRIGCFLNGCCFGKPTDSIFGVCFPSSDIKVYPTQLFSSICLFLIFAALFRLQKRRRFKGEVISLYLVCYGVFRFLIEFLRGDLEPVFHGLSPTQIISVFFIAIGGFLFYLCKHNE